MHAFLTTQPAKERHPSSIDEKKMTINNDDTKGIVARTRIDFEIDVDAICAINAIVERMARRARKWSGSFDGFERGERGAVVDVKGKEKEEK